MSTYYNPFRQWTTVELLRQREITSWELATLPAEPDIDETPTRLESATAFLQSELDDIDAEITRRERFRDSPHAPEWPQGLPDLKPFWESVKARVSVRDLYEYHYLGILRKSGSTWRGACPICELRDPDTRYRPALSIFDGERAWKCHRCLEGGDVLTLARWVFNDRDFHRATCAVADEFGIERPQQFIPPDRFSRGEASGGINGRSRNTFKPLEFRGGKVVVR
ncbi:hypothetical protein BH23CHL5_BH23CHL5_28350 [soil metagenome]